MAKKTTLSVKSLEALGPERLARLLMDISKGKPALKRQLRMALAASKGGKTLNLKSLKPKKEPLAIFSDDAVA